MTIKFILLIGVFLFGIIGGMASNAYASGKGYAWLVLTVTLLTGVLWLFLLRGKQLLLISALWDLFFCGGYFAGLVIAGQRATPMQWIGVVLALIAVVLLA